MGNVIIIILLTALVAWAVFRTVRKFRKGGGCYGEHDMVKHTSVEDRNRSHYPYRTELQISGMTC